MIYYYDEYEHGAGFVGIRVAVSVDGTVKQRYFTFHKRPGVFVSQEEEALLREDAEKLNKKWHNQQAKKQLHRRRQAKPRINQKFPCTTRVSGISLRIRKDKKNRGGIERVYYFPELAIHISHLGERHFTSIHLKKDGSNLTEKWKVAVDFLCLKKRMRNNLSLYLRQPTMSEFESLSLDE